MDELRQFKFDRLRQLAVVGLHPAHAEDLQRLLKIAVFGPEFQLLVAETNDGDYRRQLIEKINDFAIQFDLRPARLQLDTSLHPTVAAMEQALEQLAQEFNLIHIEGGDFWFDTPRWQALNVRREAIAEATQARLVFWLNTEQIKLFATQAMDCWAWRSGVFSFLKQIQRLPLQFKADLPITDNRNLAERTARLAQLQQMVKEASEPEIKIRLLDEMIEIYFSIGELSKALQVLAKQKVPLLVPELDDYNKQIAMAKLQCARYSILSGRFTEAIKVLTEEVLVCVNQVNDQAIWLQANEMLAQAWLKKDEPAKALTILQDDVLPLVQEFGEKRHALFTLIEISHALQMLGKVEESLSMLHKQVLPEAIDMGNQYLIAQVRSQVALALSMMNEYSEALRILQGDVLPIYFAMRLHHDVVRTQIQMARIMRIMGEAERAFEFLSNNALSLSLVMGGPGLMLLYDLELEMAHCLVDAGDYTKAKKILDVQLLNKGRPNTQIELTPQMQEKLHDLLQRIQESTQSNGSPEPEQIIAPQQSTI